MVVEVVQTVSAVLMMMLVRPAAHTNLKTFASAEGMHWRASSGFLVHDMVMMRRVLLLLLLTAAWMAAAAAAAAEDTSVMGTRTCIT